MPIYEYRCEDCRQESTIFFPTFSAVTSPVCDHCGSAHVRRLISLVAAVRTTGDDLGADIGGGDDDYGEDGEGDFGDEDVAGGGAGDSEDDDFED